MAKDGRLIYGPYNEKGKLFQPCDLDVCNGRMIKDRYAYVATPFYPYIAGCWGPGNYDGTGKIQAHCTLSTRVCLELKSSFALVLPTKLASLLLLASVVLFFM